MNYVITTEAGRRIEIDPGWIKGLADSRQAFCELVTDFKPIALSVEHAQAIARQDFKRALQEEHKGGCDDCFWKLNGSAPCASLCCQLAVFAIERGVDIRLQDPGRPPDLRCNIGEALRWSLLGSLFIVGLIWLHNLWRAVFRLP